MIGVGLHPHVAPDAPPSAGCAWTEEPPVLCAMDTVAHVVWDEAGQGALLCAMHRQMVLLDWCPLLVHAEQDACRHGGVIDYTGNRCVTPLRHTGPPAAARELALR